MSSIGEQLQEIVAEFVAVHGTDSLSERLRPLALACATRYPRYDDESEFPFVAGYMAARGDTR